MGKVQVNKLAKDLGVSFKDVLAAFESIGVSVKNQFAWVEDGEAARVKAKLAEAKPEAPAPAPVNANAPTATQSASVPRPQAPTGARPVPIPPRGVGAARPLAPGAGPRTGPGRPDAVAVPPRPAAAEGGPGAVAIPPRPGAGGLPPRPPVGGRPQYAIRRPIDPTALPAPGAPGAPGAGPGGRRDGKPHRPEERRSDKEREFVIKSNKPRRKSKAEIREERRTRRAARMGGPEEKPDFIELTGSLTVKELADKMKVKETEIIKKLFAKGVMATINQTIEKETAAAIAEEMDILVEFVDPLAATFATRDDLADENPEDLLPRPPIVTIMGHVDHGKTSLLDALRKATVAAGEAGGITQHIGAYMTSIHDNEICFLDTPGHEAFTAMRARGAAATDIAVLVVAADDGVMPQTIEAISHAKAANVPIVVAINKIDKPGAQPDRVKQELTEHGLVAEDWGGSTIMVEVSAKQKKNLDSLLEMILLQAEVLELKANPEREARGVIVEAKLSKGMGPVATVLVQNGTLKVGDPFVVGAISGKVRALINDRGKRVKSAGPAHPVEILGLNAVPGAGDIFQVMESEKAAKDLAGQRAEALRAETLSRRTGITLADMSSRAKEGEKELPIIIKADVKGSSEAIEQALQQLNERTEGASLRVLLSGNGDVTESDINLAEASGALVIAFNVKAEGRAERSADEKKIEIRSYEIIYKMIEDLEAAMLGLVEPEYEQVKIGTAEVRAIFTSGKTTQIAGCMVTEGKLDRKAVVKLIRDGKEIFSGKIDALKRFKDDVKEVAQGYECGVTLEKWNNYVEGDLLEAYLTQEKPRQAKK